VGEAYVSQREFDRYREATDRELAQLRHELEELERQRLEDLKSAADFRDRSVVRRIGAVGAGAGVVAAWVALVELLHASGH